jgi:hypothetical protein
MNMKFTLKIQTNSSQTFLDVMVTKKPDGSFGHMMYRKPTNLEVYIQVIAPISVTKACSQDYLF